MPVRHPPGRQRGAALILAMIVVLLATAAAVAMAAHLDIDLRRADNAARAARISEQLTGVELWAAGRLAPVSAPGQPLAYDQQAAPAQFDLASGPDEAIHARLLPLDGRYNLNNLLQDGIISEKELDRLRRLLRGLHIDPGVADAIADWIDADSTPRLGGGAEDDYYMTRTPPYHCANAPFMTVSELGRVRGVTPEVFSRLLPHVTAQPSGSLIDVNEASAEVLQAIDEAITAFVADEVISARRRSPFAKLDDFKALLARRAVVIPLDGLAVGSQHFALDVVVSGGSAQRHMQAMLARDAQGQAQVQYRTLGENDVL